MSSWEFMYWESPESGMKRKNELEKIRDDGWAVLLKQGKDHILKRLKIN